MSEIIETGITWEHDTGDIVISTRSRRIASKLRSLGLEGDGNGVDGDYETFRATENELRISFRKRRRATAAELERLARARASQNAVAVDVSG